MKIIDEVKRIVEEVMLLPFVYASFYDINTNFDGVAMPAVGFERLRNGEILNEIGQLKDDVPVLLFFVNLTENNYDSLENQAIIDVQKETMLQFIREVNKSNVIFINSSIRYDDLYNEFDVNTTGVSLRINLKERAGAVNCLPIGD